MNKNSLAAGKSAFTSSTSMVPLQWATVALLALATASCRSPLGPSEFGLPVPNEPGRLVVRVRDQAGLAVQNAYVCVEMPNSVGSFFKECSWTRPDGTTIFFAVPAGRRPVDVTPPVGFSAGLGGLIREVAVIKGVESTVEFELTRN